MNYIILTYSKDNIIEEEKLRKHAIKIKKRYIFLNQTFSNKKNNEVIIYKQTYYSKKPLKYNKNIYTSKYNNKRPKYFKNKYVK